MLDADPATTRADLEAKLRRWEAVPLDAWNRRVVCGMVQFLREQIRALATP